MRLRREILAYSKKVASNAICCGTEEYPHCGSRDEDSSLFVRHGVRARRIKVIVEANVHTVRAFVLRWRCTKCKRTFTEYPPFLIPQKHYSVPQMAQGAKAYITTGSLSYRRAVRYSRLSIFPCARRSQAAGG